MIPDQVRNDGFQVRHPDESQDLPILFLKLKMEKQAVVYIMGNDRPTLYIGVTADFYHRISQHKEELVEGFTKKYHLNKLLYFEVFDNIEEAIKREKQLKNWRRKWKLELIRKSNPEFKDLWPELFP